MKVSEDRSGIALVALPAIAGWLQIIVVLIAHLTMGDAGSVVGVLWMLAFILAMSVLAWRDARKWGLESGQWFLFVGGLFVLGFPIYMSARAKRGAALGLRAGLASLGMMLLPLIVLPLGAKVIASKLRANDARHAAVQPLVIHDSVATAPAEDTEDHAVCNTFACKVGVVGDNALATLSDPKNAGKRVEMDGPTQERFATVANAPGITKFTLSNGGRHPLSDVGPLTKLSLLQELQLWDVPLKDLSALSPLVHLETLGVHNTPLASLAGLAGLVNLKDLDLGLAHIDDLSPIAQLDHVQRLRVAAEKGAQLAPLGKLTSLRTLELVVHDANVAPVAALHGLRSLELFGKHPTGTDALARLSSLETLYLWCDVSAIPFVAGMKNLTHLDADTNKQLKDLTPLRGLQALTSVELDETAVEDVAPLASCPHLKTLSARKTKAKNLAPLASLKELVTLNLAGIDGLDLMQFVRFPALKHLTLFTGQVSDAALSAFKAAAPNVSVSLSKP